MSKGIEELKIRIVPAQNDSGKLWIEFQMQGEINLNHELKKMNWKEFLKCIDFLREEIKAEVFKEEEEEARKRREDNG